jgi:hypothetical protein
MASIGSLCPKCLVPLEKENCINCGYDSAADAFLRSIFRSEFNKSLREAKEARLERAWNRLKNAMLIYPFDIEGLRLCFVLSIEHGDYSLANACLNQLKSAINWESYESMRQELSHFIDRFNSLIGKTTDRLSSLSSYTLYELVLLFKKEKDVGQRREIANELSNRDTDIALRLSVVRETGSSRYRIPITVGVIGVCIVLVWLSISVMKYQSDLEEMRSTQTDISKSLKVVGDSLSSAEIQLNTVTNSKSSLLSWFDAFEHGDFNKCGEMLSRDSNLVRDLQGSHLEPMLHRLNNKLYELGEYRLILANGVQSTEVPHALYQVANEYYGKDQDARIDILVRFVTRYPNYPSYTGPFLREISDYYTERDRSKARHYADLLIKWSQIHKGQKQSGLVSSKVMEVAREGTGGMN